MTEEKAEDFGALSFEERKARLAARPTLLVAVPILPNGDLNGHLASFLLRIQQEFHLLWDITITIVHEKPVAATRNKIVRQFLWDPDYMHRDVLLTIDADAVPTIEGFAFLLEGIQRDDIDCINGLTYMNTKGGPMPVCQKYTADGGTVIYKELMDKDPLQGPYELIDGGTGAHCLMVKRDALIKLYDAGYIWFKDQIRDGSIDYHIIKEGLEIWKDSKDGFYDDVKAVIEQSDHRDRHHIGSRLTGQDVWFFKMCHSAGVRCWIDTRCAWGHLKITELLSSGKEIWKLTRRIHQLEGEDALKERQEKLAEDVKAMDKIEKYVKGKQEGERLVVLP